MIKINLKYKKLSLSNKDFRVKIKKILNKICLNFFLIQKKKLAL